jgi:cystathionine beta-lyase/cystathionine gamma-synthase
MREGISYSVFMPISPSSLSTLPDAHLLQPENAWIHTASVSGPFGITASVRNFDEVLDWQEKRRALTQGYYRLIHPPRIQVLKARLEKRYPGYTAVFFTSGKLAAREWNDHVALSGFTGKTVQYKKLPDEAEAEACVLHVSGANGVDAGVVLLKDSQAAGELHERNRRRGGALSVRNVDVLTGSCEGDGVDGPAQEEAAGILLRLASADHVLFYPSGMAAVTAALEQSLTPKTPGIAVMGNVYRDTHLLLEEMPWAGMAVEAHLLDTGDLPGLREVLTDPGVGAVFFETITNPLIEVPNLPEIVKLAQNAGKAVIVDSTMASPLNCRPLEWGADLVVHSTSKYLSGSNQHGGGVVLTRSQDLAKRLRRAQVRDGNELSPLEVPPLLSGLRTFSERMPRFNRNGRALADLLRSHPAVGAVYFGDKTLPEWLTGLGSVVSCELKDRSQEALARFFNAEMPGVMKAPSLGSDQTLLCPYVFLTYYDKDDAYLEACHLPRHLLRFAVGCEEDFEPVLATVRRALDGCAGG